MIKFIADFHLHSHFSRATSRNLIPELLDLWARKKGITVVGSGDFTHPGWFEELKNKLEPAEPGLFKLKSEYRHDIKTQAPLIQHNQVRFMLTAEISTIYKKKSKVRKIHHLILAPDFETVEKIQYELTKIGANITSDGRPILGLDSRNLLDLVLTISENTLLVPAHIWTPWFSALGDKSGFDSIEECYADLSDHIYAIETGLSSDPPMNRICSFLDTYTLISNSDAHSPEKLGREANLFNTELSYYSISQAIKTGDPRYFLGTVEFFPQEGKYHFDGHRKCGICWHPVETIKHNGSCPVCGKKVTVGVMNRVMQLADRDEPLENTKQPAFYPIIPLKEILAEISGVGVQSKQVSNMYNSLIRKIGSEFDILLNFPLEEIKKKTDDRIFEAIKRMRKKDVSVQEGFDGEFGRITVFGKDNHSLQETQPGLFQNISPEKPEQKKKIKSYHDLEIDKNQLHHFRKTFKAVSGKSKAASESLPIRNGLVALDPEQARAVEHFEGPALIIAGPGTGKTRVLTHRIAYLIQSKKVKPENIMAITFTNKAAGEMRERISLLLKNDSLLHQLQISTFHALGFSILRKYADRLDRDANFSIINDMDKSQILLNHIGCKKKELQKISNILNQIKQDQLSESDTDDPIIANLFNRYESALKELNAFDLNDLINAPIKLFLVFPEILDIYRVKYQWVMVDEYQDINYSQYKLIQLLNPVTHPNLVVIGDPNQAIYGFRGSDIRFIKKFTDDYPDCVQYNLKKSYRCTDRILMASYHMIHQPIGPDHTLMGFQKGIKINIVQTTTDKSEAEYVARSIEEMMGGLRFFSMDSQISKGDRLEGIEGLSDFVVLCRIKEQMHALQKAFHDHAIPYQIVGDTPFFQMEPAKTVINIIRWAKNPDSIFFKNIVFKKNKINPNLLSQIGNMTNSEHPVLDSLLKIQNFLNFQKSPDKIIFEKLLDLARHFGNDHEGFWKSISLGAGVDFYQSGLEQVTLMTLHASKGLEFKCVFIVGCEDGLLPLSLYTKTKTDIEEEKRLLYVGMTRSKHLLFLTHARKRTIHGKDVLLPRSHFLDSIEQNLVELSAIDVVKKKLPDGIQLKLFDV